MRKVGDISNKTKAERFADYLYAGNIENTLETADDGRVEVWIHDEDAMGRAREALDLYLENPEAPAFIAAGEVAADRRREERRQHTATKGNRYGRDRVFQGGFMRGLFLTRLLILLSVVATLFGGLGTGSALTQLLSFTEYAMQEGRVIFDAALPEIARGQIWRLLTPVFLHASLAAGYGILHLLFNMLWLRDLGGMMEKAQGASGLLVKVLVLGILSNTAQFITSGPAFGGMSGVVYGLLGYIWIRGRMDLTSGLYVGSQTMLLMTFWFFLCLSGAMGPIANAAHLGGLLAGLAWGWLSAWRVNKRC